MLVFIHSRILFNKYSEYILSSQMAEWLHGRPKSLNVPGSNPAGSAICPQKGLVVHDHKNLRR